MTSYYDDAKSTIRELVSTGDIARMVGVSGAAVSNWKTRYSKARPDENPNGVPRFPHPVVRTGAGPLYDKAEIETWLAIRSSYSTNK